MFDLSPQAQKTVENAHIRWRELKRVFDKFEGGPFYDAERGELVIPAYFYSKHKTPMAAREWGARRFTFDKSKREWRRAIPGQNAQDQVAKARGVYDRIWNIKRETEVTR